MADLKGVLTIVAAAAGTELYNRAQTAKGGDVSGAHAFELLLGAGITALTKEGDLINTLAGGVLAVGVAGMLGQS